MKKNLLKVSVLLVAFIILFASCKKDDPKDDDSSNFDRSKMLQHYGEQLIIPSLEKAKQSTIQLQQATDVFLMERNQNNLAILQEAWRVAYTDFMLINSFNFGPGGESGLNKSIVEETATWPANVTLIENNITNNNFTFNDFSRDNRGFHAVEYLLFQGQNADEIVLSFDQESRRNYLNALITRLVSQLSTLHNAWTSGYLSTFVSNSGTDVGSSVSLMYNEFVKSFEAMKNFKLALPLGLRLGQTGPEPALVEARYSGESLRYLIAHWSAIKNLWYGRDAVGNDGEGWREYLESVEGGDALISATEAQMNDIDQALQNLPIEPSLEQQISTNFAALNDLHTKFQQHTRFFKSDMSSVLGITITYSSGDGD